MCKVIVIDDNPTDHYIMRRLLHKNNDCNQATFTYDGSLVLDYLEENKNYASRMPDVIFLDLDMPEITGWEFLDELEKLVTTARKKVKVHIMSSSVQSKDVFKSKKYNCVNSYLTKPLSSDVLKKICSLEN